MSTFLSAPKNVAHQCQNIQRDLKKMEDESRTAELALEGHNFCLFLVSAVHEKCFCYSNVFIHW